jgi:peroxiredoxin (alkyl hydroperoxide reductase subunit C)
MSVLVGAQAPAFRVPAVLGTGEIVEGFDYPSAVAGKYTFLFFYPLDFTFVCPTELIALDHRLEEFRQRDTEVIGISVDSHYTHHAWRRIPVAQGGIGAVGFTLAADIGHMVCRAYGVEAPGSPVALRASFLVDRQGTVRHQVVNDLPLGRNIDEMLRMLDALRFHEQHGEVCPAGWRAGDAAMQESPEGVAAYLEEHAAAL